MMNLDNFKSTWQQADFSGPRFDELAARVRQQTTKFESQIFRRDMIENAAAIVVIVGVTPSVFTAPNLTMRLGFLIVVLGVIGIVLFLETTRRRDRRPVADLSLRDYCQLELVRIDRQIWLLENILWWYIGPTLIGAFVVAIGKPSSIYTKCVIGSFFLSLCMFVFWLNKRSARRHLRPLRESVESVLAQCDSQPSLPDKGD